MNPTRQCVNCSLRRRVFLRHDHAPRGRRGELLDSVERGEWKPAKGGKRERARYSR